MKLVSVFIVLIIIVSCTPNEKNNYGFNTAITITPENIEAYSKGEVLKDILSSKEPKEAIKYYDKVISLNPDNAMAYMCRAIARDELGKHQEALKDYDKAIQIKPGFSEVYVNRGNLRDDLGERKGAMEDYNKAIEIYQYGVRFILPSTISLFYKELSLFS